MRHATGGVQLTVTKRNASPAFHQPYSGQVIEAMASALRPPMVPPCRRSGPADRFRCSNTYMACPTASFVLIGAQDATMAHRPRTERERRPTGDRSHGNGGGVVPVNHESAGIGSHGHAAASAMQAAGGIDYLVTVAEKLIRARPQSVNIIAPVVSLLFCAGKTF